MAASSVLGGAFGIVGSLAGAVGGAVLGSKAGSAATTATCDTIDSVQAGTVCEDCQAAEKTRAARSRDFGGGRLGDGTSTGAPTTAKQSVAEPSLGDRVSGAASSAGEGLSSAASTAGTHIGSAASTAGTHISGAASWVRQSVSSAVGGGDDKTADGGSAATGKNGTFKAFAGTGQTLGGAAPRVPAASPSQVQDDEAMARRLQEEFLREDQANTRSSGGFF